MLRRDIRLMVFVASFILLFVALYQFKTQHFQTSQSQPNAAVIDFHVDSNSIPKEQIRNLMSVQRNDVSNEDNQEPLPESSEYLLSKFVVQDVTQFVFFVGYARSGHSIVASILDAHPHIVISHEYSLFAQWENEPSKHSDKSWLFSSLYGSSKKSADDGLRREVAKKKGYSLAIPGWWQGSFDNTIFVIGDKSGGLTAQVYRRSKQTFKSLYQELKSTVQIPIKVIHVVRNPYDNIATMLLYNTHQKRKVNASNQYDNVEKLREQITSYFNQVRSVVDMIQEIPLNVIEIHNSDMIANPKGVMRDVCSKLYIDCSEEYLHMCAETMFVSESKTRNFVKWTPQLIDMVGNHIQSYKHLQRYSFTL